MTTEVTGGLEGVLCHMDDILVWGQTQDEHDMRLHAVLEKAQKAGIMLNMDKCELTRHTVRFLGHVISADGVKPDLEKTRAVQEMDAPKNVSELRSFLGMVNQLGRFLPNLAEKDKVLRDLLSKKNHWYWGTEQQAAFDQLKTELSSTPVLALYNPNSALKISADASSFGLGTVLLQKSDVRWSPVAYASRSMTPTEQRYAQVEKEALAAAWACERFSCFILGRPFELETDHKPLVSLLGGKALDDLPPRIQRFRMRLMRYNYTVNHAPGIPHGICEVLKSDNGPQFSGSHFKAFAAEYGFVNITSSPKFPQSNGEAERAVQTVKNLLTKASDPYLALLAYRATPLQNGYSPAELLMGRRLRTTVPALPTLLNPVLPDYYALEAKERVKRGNDAKSFNKRHGARNLEPLVPGEDAWITDARVQGTVLSTHNTPRSYIVQVPHGTLRRNRHHLVPLQTNSGVVDGRRCTSDNITRASSTGDNITQQRGLHHRDCADQVWERG